MGVRTPLPHITPLHSFEQEYTELWTLPNSRTQTLIPKVILWTCYSVWYKTQGLYDSTTPLPILTLTLSMYFYAKLNNVISASLCSDVVCPHLPCTSPVYILICIALLLLQAQHGKSYSNYWRGKIPFWDSLFLLFFTEQNKVMPKNWCQKKV